MPAIIFDCDGVLSDTEKFGHLPAFNQMFKEFNLPVFWSEADYGEKLKIAGGKERLFSLLTPEFIKNFGLPLEPTAQKALVVQWHQRKTELYKQMVSEGKLPARPGIRRLVQEAHQAHWQLAVASTSAEESVRQVLVYAVGEELASHFEVLAGDVVVHKKPAPDIYCLALARLGASAQDALVIEDSRNGLLAATHAGIKCLVTLSSYTLDEDMKEALIVVDSLGEADKPMRIYANLSRARLQTCVTLNDLHACLK